MKRSMSIAMLSSALVVSGCASTGGLATSANGGCNTGMSTAVGALLGAAIGASVGDSSYAATGAAIGGAVFAAGCLMINAHTIQKNPLVKLKRHINKPIKGNCHNKHGYNNTQQLFFLIRRFRQTKVLL